MYSKTIFLSITRSGFNFHFFEKSVNRFSILIQTNQCDRFYHINRAIFLCVFTFPKKVKNLQKFPGSTKSPEKSWNSRFFYLPVSQLARIFESFRRLTEIFLNFSRMNCLPDFHFESFRRLTEIILNFSKIAENRAKLCHWKYSH